MIYLTLILSILSLQTIFANQKLEEAVSQKEEVIFMQILEEQPDLIECVREEKIYLKAENIIPTRQGCFLLNHQNAIALPTLFSDENGCYIPCRNDRMWHYKCSNARCGRVWDANLGGKCPSCGSSGQVIH